MRPETSEDVISDCHRQRHRLCYPYRMIRKRWGALLRQIELSLQLRHCWEFWLEATAAQQIKMLEGVGIFIIGMWKGRGSRFRDAKVNLVSSLLINASFRLKANRLQSCPFFVNHGRVCNMESRLSVLYSFQLAHSNIFTFVFYQELRRTDINTSRRNK